MSIDSIEGWSSGDEQCKLAFHLPIGWLVLHILYADTCTHIYMIFNFEGVLVPYRNRNTNEHTLDYSHPNILMHTLHNSYMQIYTHTNY